MASKRRKKNVDAKKTQAAVGRQLNLAEFRDLDERKARNALATELLSTCMSAIGSYGLSSRDISRLTREAIMQTSRIRISSRILAATQQLSDLIAKWSDDSGYLDSAGKPAVLPIRKGLYDFTSLANEFFPGSSVQDVLEFAHKTKAIEWVGDGQVARMNDYVVFAGHSLLIFAYTVQTIRRYLSTAKFNKQKRVANSLHLGRPDRTSASFVSLADVNEYMRDMRPQVGDMSDSSTRWLERRAKTAARHGAKRKTVGIQVFLFVDP